MPIGVAFFADVVWQKQVRIQDNHMNPFENCHMSICTTVQLSVPADVWAAAEVHIYRKV